jgi:hypothetical protein
MSQQINLLNPALLRRPFALNAATALLAGVIAALAGSGGYAWHEQQRLAVLEGEAAALESRVKELRGQKLSAQPPAARAERATEAELAQLAARLKTRHEVLHLLEGAGVGDTRGFSEYLRAFAAPAIDGLWLTGFDIADGGGELTITGRALRAELVPAYLERLNREGVLQGRQFASMHITEPEVRSDATGGTKPPPEAAPRFLQFEISSAGVREGTGAGAPGRGAKPPPLAALTQRPRGAAEPRVSGEARR